MPSIPLSRYSQKYVAMLGIEDSWSIQMRLSAGIKIDTFATRVTNAVPARETRGAS